MECSPLEEWPRQLVQVDQVRPLMTPVCLAQPDRLEEGTESMTNVIPGIDPVVSQLIPIQLITQEAAETVPVTRRVTSTQVDLRANTVTLLPVLP